ncbi:MAG: DoxX family protein [Armatimonadetes bacterium]|nr:DoxX family protein [Armatimonadota bacterium]
MTGELRAQGIALFIARLVLGSLMLYYGLHNVFGLMDGPGIASAATKFSENFDVHSSIGYVAFYGQLAAGVLLLVGFMTRIAGIFVGTLMTIAAVKGIRATETLVMTTSEDAVAAVGYPTALLALSLMLIFLGAGIWAVDTFLVENSRTGRRVRRSREA